MDKTRGMRVLAVLFSCTALLVCAQENNVSVTFVEPTPPNGYATTETTVVVNASIIAGSNLTSASFTWNGNSTALYDDSLVLMLNFDNVSALGEVYGVGCGIVKDASARGNDGILGNPSCSPDMVPAWTADGRHGGAFQFDTTDFNTNGDSILIPHDDSLNPGSGDFAVAMWVRYGNLGDTDLLRKGCTETNAGGGWYKVEAGADGHTNSVSFNTVNSAGTSKTVYAPNNIYNDSQWHYIVAQRRADMMEIWVDGAKQAETSISGSISNPANLTVGSKDTQNDDFFKGAIDEVRVYMRSFSGGEIRQLYATNVNRYGPSDWTLLAVESGLGLGTYSYQASASDVGGEVFTEVRSVTVEEESYVCGNGVKEPGEQCDGVDLGGETCISLGGYVGGDLSCTANCTYDTTGCIQDPCGDGYCDGPAGETCNTCPADCQSGQYAACGDGYCDGSSWDETCNTCPADCTGGSVSGGTCSACFKGACDGVCHPTKETPACYDCNPGITYCCGDGTCNGNENAVNCPVDCGSYAPPAHTSCCGDGVCNGDEDVASCLTDCGCEANEDCDDGSECTQDVCNAGACEYNPVFDGSPCAAGICCAGSCKTPTCTSDTDCSDANACTTDTCQNPWTCTASCSSTWPSCGIADGCCGPTCGSGDPDCTQATCAACWKGRCDGVCNTAKEGPACLDCA